MTQSCQNLDAFFDGELDHQEHELFKAHISDCVRCQNVLVGLIQEQLAKPGKP